MALYIYHETQTTQSALCGVHCLNALLQRPAYTAVDLAQIAKELDESERAIMAAAGHDTKDFLKFMREDSGNVGDDGNFSLQVLQAALRKRNLDCVPLTSTNYYTVICNLGQETAFICNRGSHWFTIRKVLPGEWYNLNSLLSEPQHMPEASLASFLDSLFDNKDTCIYSIKGALPSISPENRPSGNGRWIPVTGSNKEEFELKVAIELSKATTGPSDTRSADAIVNEISYPKLPDFKNEKISYPTLEAVDEQPLTLKSRPIAPVFDTKELSIPEHIRVMNDYFGRMVNMMEKMEQRLNAVEQSFAKIQAQQK